MKILILSLIASVCSIFVLNSNVESADYISWLKRTDISIEAADDVDTSWPGPPLMTVTVINN